MASNLNPARHTHRDPFAVHSLSVSSAIGYDIHEFLAWEALLLDSRRYGEWTALLAKDMSYRCPGRPDEERSYNLMLWHLRRNPSPGAEASPHMQRFLSNVIVTYDESPHRFIVASYILINYSRSDSSDTESFIVSRRDHLRRSSATFQVTHREVRTGRIAPDVRELVGPL